MSEETFKYKSETFDGPLDLLLTLIQKNKVSIYDIPIAEILDQYVDYMEEMKIGQKYGEGEVEIMQMTKLQTRV